MDKDKTKDWDTQAVIHWLFHEGRLMSDRRKFTEGLGRKLVEVGAPVWRFRLGCRTIHPMIAAWSILWSTDMDQASEPQAGHGFEANDTYIGSPMQIMNDTGEPYRKRLDQLVEDQDHRLLFEMAANGATDYLGVPFLFSDGEQGSVILTSKSPGGFSNQDIEKFIQLSSYIAPVFEVYAIRRMAGAIIDTYVGRRTGKRVLSGQIKRGDGETIHAAVWFSDLRNFTPLTEKLPAKELIALLNTYFEAVSAAVTARGGEVLRFIGDAMLIVFPVSEQTPIDQACEAALDAAEDAFRTLATQNSRRRRAHEPEIDFGVGLHVGEVIYGNVGAPDRLDFTVMGPAVNRTARLESLTKKVGEPLLMSRRFARSIGRETRSCGLWDMKGVEEKQEVFALT